MSGRVRELLDRPIDSGARTRTFALAVGVLVLAAAALQLTARPHTQPTPAAAPTPLAAAAPGSPRPRPLARPGSLRGPQETARRFLAGYLRYLYGHGPARRIQAASPRLVRRLGRARLQVSPATRRRRPRVLGLKVRRAAIGPVVVAVIDDGGVAHYPIELALRRVGGEWVVRGVGVQ